ncbi:MAG TPA: MerR family transcriptional regulator [Albitalea sp.]|nr:MerR family transcriptional regulator [Albitalea sp.]
MPTHAFTIRKLADAAGVGVEAVRYYQRLGLLAEPAREGGGFREYSGDDLRRLRFIKRAQELGFSLDDVAELSALSAGTERSRIREITRERADDIRRRVRDLNAMADVLDRFAERCASSSSATVCPIVAALTGDTGSPEAASRAKSPVAARRARAVGRSVGRRT